MNPTGFRRLCQSLRKCSGLRLKFKRAPLPKHLASEAWAACLARVRDVRAPRMGGPPDHFLIWVEPGLGQPALTYILIHEVAHAMTWKAGPLDIEAQGEWGGHPPEFWLAHGRLYDALVHRGGMIKEPQRLT